MAMPADSHCEKNIVVLEIVVKHFQTLPVRNFHRAEQGFYFSGWQFSCVSYHFWFWNETSTTTYQKPQNKSTITNKQQQTTLSFKICEKEGFLNKMLSQLMNSFFKATTRSNATRRQTPKNKAR